jgi:hypothetical protein
VLLGEPISIPYLARHHHRPDGPFRSPVRGLHAGTVREGDQSVALPQKMIGQASIPQGAVARVAMLNAPIEPGFQSSAGHGYTVVADDDRSVAELAATGLVSDAEILLPAISPAELFPDSVAEDGPGSFGAGIQTDD